MGKGLEAERRSKGVKSTDAYLWEAVASGAELRKPWDMSESLPPRRGGK